MISVLPNGGAVPDVISKIPLVALDDISATEWRLTEFPYFFGIAAVALDDISATEWRVFAGVVAAGLRLVALDDISATEWRDVRFNFRVSAFSCTR